MKDTVYVIEVEKFIADGEELQDTIGKVMRAVRDAGSAKQQIFQLMGIYKDHVVVRAADDGQYYRLSLKLSEKGALELGDPEPGRVLFVPFEKAKDGEDGGQVVKFKCPKCGKEKELKAQDVKGPVTCACGTEMKEAEKVAKAAGLDTVPVEVTEKAASSWGLGINR